MNVWTVYWLFKLDDLRASVMACSFIGFIALAIFLVMYGVGKYSSEYEGDCEGTVMKKIAVKFLRPIIPIWIFCFMSSTLLPSTKTMAAIIVLPRIASAENLDIVAKDGGDIYKLAMARLKESLGEVK